MLFDALDGRDYLRLARCALLHGDFCILAGAAFRGMKLDQVKRLMELEVKNVGQHYPVRRLSIATRMMAQSSRSMDLSW